MWWVDIAGFSSTAVFDFFFSLSLSFTKFHICMWSVLFYNWIHYDRETLYKTKEKSFHFTVNVHFYFVFIRMCCTCVERSNNKWTNCRYVCCCSIVLSGAATDSCSTLKPFQNNYLPCYNSRKRVNLKCIIFVNGSIYRWIRNASVLYMPYKLRVSKSNLKAERIGKALRGKYKRCLG